MHQMLMALQKAGLKYTFFTTVWDKNSSPLVRLSKWVFPFTRVSFSRRSFPLLEERNIRINLFPELIRLVLSKIWPSQSDRWVFLIDRMHDARIARKMAGKKFDVFVGYENASRLSLQIAKRLGKITILDLAHVHHSLTQQVYDRFLDFRAGFSSEALMNEMSTLKNEQNKFVDHFIVLSTLARESLVRAKFPIEKIHVTNPGFDPSRFKRKIGYSKKGFRILYVGTITKKKGVHLLVEAFNHLSLQDATLHLLGAVSHDNTILNNINFPISHTGFVDHAHLASIYQEADLFVFPSFLDSWAMVVIEAMACGLPVIVSENTGAKDAVEQGGGFVVPVGDVEAIKEKILFFYHNRSALQEMGEKAYQIAQHYTWENYHAQIKKIFDKISEKNQQ